MDLEYIVGVAYFVISEIQNHTKKTPHNYSKIVKVSFFYDFNTKFSVTGVKMV